MLPPVLHTPGRSCEIKEEQQQSSPQCHFVDVLESMQSDEDSSGNSVIEVEEENNEWWDNFQEDPSYLEVSVNSAQESEEAERHTRRQSSTRDNLLDSPPGTSARQILRIRSGYVTITGRV